MDHVPVPLTIDDWLPDHQAQAQAQGWDIFDNGADYSQGQWTVSRIDDPEAWDLERKPLSGDDAAWRILHRGYVQGNLLCLHAINIMQAINPAEYDRIMSA